MPQPPNLRWFIALNTQVGPWSQNQKFSEKDAAEKYPQHPDLIEKLLADKAIAVAEPDAKPASPASPAPLPPGVMQATVPAHAVAK